MKEQQVDPIKWAVEKYNQDRQTAADIRAERERMQDMAFRSWLGKQFSGATPEYFEEQGYRIRCYRMYSGELSMLIEGLCPHCKMTAWSSPIIDPVQLGCQIVAITETGFLFETSAALHLMDDCPTPPTDRPLNVDLSHE